LTEAENEGVLETFGQVDYFKKVYQAKKSLNFDPGLASSSSTHQPQPQPLAIKDQCASVSTIQCVAGDMKKTVDDLLTTNAKLQKVFGSTQVNVKDQMVILMLVL